MKIYFILICIFNLLGTHVQSAPIWVRNGGGASELYFLSAKQDAMAILNQCAATESCHDGIDSALELLKTSQALSSSLKFIPNQNFGMQVYQTKELPGADILISQSQLWKNDIDGKQVPFEFVDAIECLTQAWLEQLGIRPDVRMLVAQRIKSSVQQNGQRVSYLGALLKSFSLIHFTYNPEVLFIEDNEYSADSQSLKIDWKSHLDCQDVVNKKTKVENFKLISVYWGNFSTNRAAGEVTVNGKFFAVCAEKEYSANYRIQLPMILNQQTWRIETRKPYKIIQTQIEIK